VNPLRRRRFYNRVKPGSTRLLTGIRPINSIPVINREYHKPMQTDSSPTIHENATDSLDSEFNTFNEDFPKEFSDLENKDFSDPSIRPADQPKYHHDEGDSALTPFERDQNRRSDLQNHLSGLERSEAQGGGIPCFP